MILIYSHSQLSIQKHTGMKVLLNEKIFFSTNQAKAKSRRKFFARISEPFVLFLFPPWNEVCVLEYVGQAGKKIFMIRLCIVESFHWRIKVIRGLRERN